MTFFVIKTKYFSNSIIKRIETQIRPTKNHKIILKTPHSNDVTLTRSPSHVKIARYSMVQFLYSSNHFVYHRTVHSNLTIYAVFISRIN